MLACKLAGWHQSWVSTLVEICRRYHTQRRVHFWLLYYVYCRHCLKKPYSTMYVWFCVIRWFLTIPLKRFGSPQFLHSRVVMYKVAEWWPLSCLHSSQAVVWSENCVTLGVTSADTKASTEPHGKGSSFEKQHGCKHTATKSQSGLNQGVRQNDIPLESC